MSTANLDLFINSLSHYIDNGKEDITPDDLLELAEAIKSDLENE